MAEEAEVTQDSPETVLTAQENTDAVEGGSEVEVKAEGDATAAAKSEGDAKPDEAEAKPEGDDGEAIEYGEFTVPEGFELDEAAMENALPVFKELGLNQEQAQKLVEVYASEQQRQSQALGEQYKELTDKWVNQIHEEWGAKDSEKFKSNMATAAKAVDFGGPEFRDALNETGAGNHPAMAKFLHRVGKALSEDVMGGKPAQGQKAPLEERLYTSMKPGA